MPIRFKYYMLEGFLLWPGLALLIVSVWQISYLKPNSIVDAITYFLYYGLGTMSKQFLMYVLNGVVLMVMRRLYFRIPRHFGYSFSFFSGLLAGGFAYFILLGFHLFITPLYENVVSETYFIIPFAVVGGMFFLLGQFDRAKRSNNV